MVLVLRIWELLLASSYPDLHWSHKGGSFSYTSSPAFSHPKTTSPLTRSTNSDA